VGKSFSAARRRALGLAAICRETLRASISSGVGRADRTPRPRAEGQGLPVQRPPANAVLTTVVDTWGRSWTPICPGRSSRLIRRTAVDSRGLGHSPEKRKARPAEPLRASAPSVACARVSRLSRCAAELSRTGSRRRRLRRRGRRQRPASALAARPGARRPRLPAAGMISRAHGTRLGRRFRRRRGEEPCPS
jgi:hypothetical protein